MGEVNRQSGIIISCNYFILCVIKVVDYGVITHNLSFFSAVNVFIMNPSKSHLIAIKNSYDILRNYIYLVGHSIYSHSHQ